MVHRGVKRRFPGRRLFGEAELEAVTRVFEASWESDKDFGYQGDFEHSYTKAFSEFQGGGFSDGVSSGTAAVYLAVAALELPPGSEVVISPVTDPGGVTPLIAQGLVPVVADADPSQFNTSAEQIERVLSPRTSAIMVTHTGGIPCNMNAIQALAHRRHLALIEDCSQAHGARWQGLRVGTFGDTAAFSTMFSKLHASGGCGGLVFTRSQSLYQRICALADRGKDPLRADFHPKDPNTFCFPALNFNMDELSAAIGLSTLSKLDTVIEERKSLVDHLNQLLAGSDFYHPLRPPVEAEPAYFFHTIRLTDKHKEVLEQLKGEQLPLNPDYRYLPVEWGWLKPHLGGNKETPHAQSFRDQSINFLFHERFSLEDVAYVAEALLSTEALAGTN